MSISKCYQDFGLLKKLPVLGFKRFGWIFWGGLLIFVCLSLVIASTALWFSNRQLEDSADTRLSVSLRYLGRWLEDQHSSNQSAANSLALQRNVTAALLQHERGKLELERMLAGNLLNTLQVNFIAFVDNNRNIIASDPPDLSAEVITKNSLEAALSGKALPAHAEKVGDNLFLIAAAPVVSENQPIGVVVVGDLLDDNSAAAIDLKKVIGLDVAIIVGNHVQSTTLPFKVEPTTVDQLLDVKVVSYLKSEGHFVQENRLANRSYTIGYQAILCNHRLVGEMLVFLPSEELRYNWYKQALMVSLALLGSWLIVGITLYWLVIFLRRQLHLMPTPTSLTTLKAVSNLDRHKSLKIVSETSVADHPPLLESPSNTATSKEKEREEFPLLVVSQISGAEPQLKGENSSTLVETESKSYFDAEKRWEYAGQLAINRGAYEIKVAGQPLPITRTEFELLYALFSRPYNAITRQELLDLVWGKDYLGEPGTVDAHISNLRRKIEIDPAKPNLILTVRGVGYKFQLPPE